MEANLFFAYCVLYLVYCSAICLTALERIIIFERMKKITSFFGKLNSKNKDNQEKNEAKTESKSSSFKDRVLSIFGRKSKCDLEATLDDADTDVFNLTELLDKSHISNKNVSEEQTPSTHCEDKRASIEVNIEVSKQYFDKPNQPIIDFPQNEQKRRFQEKWYKQFSWIEYDVSTDAVFCFICKQYPVINKDKTSFKSTGFKDWHNAKKLFTLHENSEGHKRNQMLLQNRINVEKSKKSCATLVSLQHAKEVAANRKYMKLIIQTIHFLARQGLAYRGHNEDTKTSKNLGNFKELLDFHCALVPEFKENLDSKVAKYTSPTIQNDIIHLISKQIIQHYLPLKYYAIICDETMDLSRKEMLALCIRQVDDSLSIHENFFGFFRAKIQTADGIFNLIKNVLIDHLKLDLQLMVAQSFDGAATMAGVKSGVAKRFLD